LYLSFISSSCEAIIIIITRHRYNDGLQLTNCVLLLLLLLLAAAAAAAAVCFNVAACFGPWLHQKMV